MKAAAFAITVLQSKLRSDPYLPEIRKSPPQKGWTSLFLLVKAGLNMQFLSEPANRLPGSLLPLHPGCTQVLPPARPSKRHPATPTEDKGRFTCYKPNYLDSLIVFCDMFCGAKRDIFAQLALDGSLSCRPQKGEIISSLRVRL